MIKKILIVVICFFLLPLSGCEKDNFVESYDRYKNQGNKDKCDEILLTWTRSVVQTGNVECNGKTLKDYAFNNTEKVNNFITIIRDNSTSIDSTLALFLLEAVPILHNKKYSYDDYLSLKSIYEDTGNANIIYTILDNIILENEIKYIKYHQKNNDIFSDKKLFLVDSYDKFLDNILNIEYIDSYIFDFENECRNLLNAIMLYKNRDWTLRECYKIMQITIMLNEENIYSQLVESFKALAPSIVVEENNTAKIYQGKSAEYANGDCNFRPFTSLEKDNIIDPSIPYVINKQYGYLCVKNQSSGEIVRLLDKKILTYGNLLNNEDSCYFGKGFIYYEYEKTIYMIDYFGKYTFALRLINNINPNSMSFSDSIVTFGVDNRIAVFDCLTKHYLEIPTDKYVAFAYITFVDNKYYVGYTDILGEYSAGNIEENQFIVDLETDTYIDYYESY